MSRTEKFLDNPYALATFCLGSGVLSLMLYGYSAHGWLAYGWNLTTADWQNYFQFDFHASALHSVMGPIRNSWWPLFSSIYSSPPLYFASIILNHAFLFYLTARLLQKETGSSASGVAGAAIFLLAKPYSTSLGYTLFESTPVFSHFTVFSLILIGALTLLYKDKIWAASLLTAISFHVHILFGLSSFSCIALAYLIFSIKNKHPSKIISLTLLPAISLGYLYLSQQISLPGTDLTQQEWWHFCWTRDPDDVSIIYSLKYNQSSLFLLAGYLTYLAIRGRSNATLTNAFVEATALVCTAAILVELLHINGIFMGKISEVFTAVQFRRMLWMPHFFILLGSLKLLRKDSSWSCQNALLFSGYLLANIMGLVSVEYLVIGFSLWKIWTTGNKPALFVSMAGVTMVTCLQLTNTMNGFAFSLPSPSIFFNFDRLRFFLLATAFTIFLTVNSGIRKENYPLLLALLLCTALLPLARLVNITHNVSTIVSILQQDNVSYLYLLKVTQTYEYDSSFQDVVDKAKKYRDKGSILVPPHKRISPRNGIPSFVDERGRGLSLYSLSYARYYDFRLKELLGVGISDIYNSKEYLKKLQDCYRSLDKKNLISFMRKNHIPAVITEHPIPGMQPAFANDKYYLYANEL